MLKLERSRLNELFAAIAAEKALYLPIDVENGGARYTRWQDGAVLSEALNTRRSAKDFFFPQTEDLVEFQVDGKSIQVIDTRTEAEDFVIFGVRACDAASFDILDRVFLSDPIDSYYAERRKHGIIMTMACTAPEESCFCGAFGIDPTAPGGDISCWMDNDYLYLEANTEKGSALAASLGCLLYEADSAPVTAQAEQTRAIMAQLPLHELKPAAFTQKQLMDVFNSDKWSELSEACLGCGSCTFVCPTCQCYDIKDFDTGHGIKRMRTWDSCMYSEFTKMSAGNPRLTQLERFRQRFMHKLVYFPINNDGIYGCVGCGRCLRKCPISMNIVKVMKALGGSEND